MKRFSVQIRVQMEKKNIGSACKVLESETDFQKRARIEIVKEKEGILVNIDSEDVSSLHAAVGSILRAVKVIVSVDNHAKECEDEDEEEK